jgi:hypothetical protein
MATCKFGEDITKYVIHLYEHRLEDRYDKKVNFTWKDVLIFCLIHCYHNINSKAVDIIIMNNWFLMVFCIGDHEWIIKKELIGTETAEMHKSAVTVLLWCLFNSVMHKPQAPDHLNDHILCCGA